MYTLIIRPLIAYAWAAASQNEIKKLQMIQIKYFSK